MGKRKTFEQAMKLVKKEGFSAADLINLAVIKFARERDEVALSIKNNDQLVKNDELDGVVLSFTQFIDSVGDKGVELVKALVIFKEFAEMVECDGFCSSLLLFEESFKELLKEQEVKKH